MTDATDAAGTTIGRLLEETKEELARRGFEDPARAAETLVAGSTALPHAQLRDRAAEPVDAGAAKQCRQWATQAAPDAPVAYLVGQAPFFDLDFAVTQDTLIPKRDTELFLEIVFARVEREPLPPDPHVLELCCGSGCVAVTLARRLPGARVVATDISEAALRVARQNVDRHGVGDQVALGLGDLFSPVAELAAGRPFDFIVSNPPYIPTEAIPGMGRAVADHEPRLALDGGRDGLDPHRRILSEGAKYLAPGACVFLEHEHYSGEAARSLAARLSEYEGIETFQDANGKDRALFARRRRT